MLAKVWLLLNPCIIILPLPTSLLLSIVSWISSLISFFLEEQLELL
jgi:hypothetical protein